MPWSWVEALSAYSWPVDLRSYERAQDFPGFFEMSIEGDRESTMVFEGRFRDMAPSHIEVIFEALYWKLFGLRGIAQSRTSIVAGNVLGRGVTSAQMWRAIQDFVKAQTTLNLRRIRGLLGMTSKVIVAPLTLPALASRGAIPMIDKWVARWVNRHGSKHSAGKVNTLEPFPSAKYSSLRESDFESYCRWVAWCREVARVLTDRTQQTWRVRDVEMAVFTAVRECLVLNVVP